MNTFPEEVISPANIGFFDQEPPRLTVIYYSLSEKLKHVIIVPKFAGYLLGIDKDARIISRYFFQLTASWLFDQEINLQLNKSHCEYLCKNRLFFIAVAILSGIAIVVGSLLGINNQAYKTIFRHWREVINILFNAKAPEPLTAVDKTWKPLVKSSIFSLLNISVASVILFFCWATSISSAGIKLPGYTWKKMKSLIDDSQSSGSEPVAISDVIRGGILAMSLSVGISLFFLLWVALRSVKKEVFNSALSVFNSRIILKDNYEEIENSITIR